MVVIKGTIRVPKVQYACVDCGNKSKWKRPCEFKQPKETYRCWGCSSQTPEFKATQSKNTKKYFETAYARQRSSESQKLARQKLEVKERMSKGQKKRFERPEERKKNSDTQNRPKVKQLKSEAQKKRFEDPICYENHLICVGGQGFWYGHPILHPENKRNRYCELWNRFLWVRIDAAWEYKSALSGVTRWETPSKRQLSRHHVYWQEKACCVWDEDAQGYYAMINNGTKAKPEMIKYYIKGDPNKFVLLTASEHRIVNGCKKSGKDKIYWVKYFEDLIEKREAEGKPCYISKEDYEVYKVEHADVIAYYTQSPKKFAENEGYNPTNSQSNNGL